MDDSLLERLDWLVVRGAFENRAEVVRAAIDAMAKQERDREIDEQIVEAYTRMPQRPDESVALTFSSWNELEDDDWSDWF